MSDLVLRETHGAAAHLILNRPDKLNSLNVPVFEALDGHIRDIAAALVLAYVLASTVVTVPYLRWRRKARVSGAPTAG